MAPSIGQTALCRGSNRGSLGGLLSSFDATSSNSLHANVEVQAGAESCGVDDGTDVDGDFLAFPPIEIWPTRQVRRQSEYTACILQPTHELLSVSAQQAREDGRGAGLENKCASSSRALAAAMAPASFLSRVGTAPSAGTKRRRAAHAMGGQNVANLKMSASAPSLLNDSSRALQSFDKQLSREFREQERTQREREQRPPSRSSSPLRAASAPSGDTPDYGLSLPTRRENFKKERYRTEIERGANAAAANRDRVGHGADDALHMTGDSDSGLMSAAMFADDVKSLNQVIEEYARHIRLEHLQDSSQDEQRRRQREEAERRLREEAERRARKKEQEARDPHRKVKMRLEYKRRFEADVIEKGEGIPMYKLDVHGRTGPEQVPLVDVRMLRAKAQGLEAGDGVSEMLEKMRRKSINERYLAKFASRPGSRPFSALSFEGEATTATAHSVLSFDTLSELSYEERYERAHRLKEEQYVDEILRKIGAMRAKHKCDLPFTFMLTQGELPADLMGSTVGLAPPRHQQRSSAACSKELGRALLGRASVCQGSKIGKRESLVQSSTFKKLMDDVLGKDGFEPPRTSTQDAARRSSIRANDLLNAQHAAATKRAQRRWAVLRSCVKLIMVSFRVNRMNRSAEIVKNLCRHLGEWARMKFSVKKVMRSVKTLQGTCRKFMATKHKRCDLMQREWQRLEDQHLSAYFKFYAQKILLEKFNMDLPGEGGQVRRKKIMLSEDEKGQMRFYKQLQENVEADQIGIDWRQYRIPAKERRAVIGRWYMTQLKKHVRSHNSLLKTVLQAVQSERDLHNFLKKFGAGVSDSAEAVVVSSYTTENGNPKQAEYQLPYWQYTEDTLLQLIALSAQALVKVDPFKDHPANKDLPEKPKEDARKGKDEISAVSRSRAIRSATALGGRKFAALPSKDADSVILANIGGLENLDKGVTLGRLTKRPHQKDQSTGRSHVELPRGNNKLNVEDLLNGFTPRLREISTEQQRSHKKGGHTELLGGEPPLF